MQLEVKFQLNKTKEIKDVIEAIKVFWYSRLFRVRSESSSSIHLTRGRMGYGKLMQYISIEGSNPLNYYYELTINITVENDNLLVTCHIYTEHGTINTLHDVFIKSELLKFETYIQNFSAGKQQYIRSLSEVKIKKTISQYILNIIPGLGLLFCGHTKGILIGIGALIAGILGAYSIDYEIQNLRMGIMSLIINVIYVGDVGAHFVTMGNYERIYNFDNE